MTRRSIPFAALAAAYLALVAVITLGPTPWRTRTPDAGYDVLTVSTWLDPDTWQRVVTPEFVANILLFVPIGVLLRLALPRASWVGAVVFGATVSIAIEVLQIGSTRVSDPRDVIANTAGAVIGALLGQVIVGISRAARRGVPPAASPVTPAAVIPRPITGPPSRPITGPTNRPITRSIARPEGRSQAG